MYERCEEHRIIEQRINTPQLIRQHQQLGRQVSTSHNVGWSFTVLSTMASIPSSPRG